MFTINNRLLDNCDHSIIIKDNNGETCQICGKIISGYGCRGEVSSSCNHKFLNTGDGLETCVYCEETKEKQGE